MTAKAKTVEMCCTLDCTRPAVYALYPSPGQDSYICSEHAKSERWSERSLYLIGHELSIAEEKKQTDG